MTHETNLPVLRRELYARCQLYFTANRQLALLPKVRELPLRPTRDYAALYFYSYAIATAGLLGWFIAKGIGCSPT